MSGRAARGLAHADDDRATLLSLPLRVAALSWGLGTLPLTAFFLLFSKLTALCDGLLALVGLTRRGRAAALALVSENALRAQLRSSSVRLKATQEQLRAAEASRRLAERELGLQREREQGARSAHPASADPGDAPKGVPGALRRVLYISSAACAASVAALVDVPHLSIERKIVTVSLVPTGLLFLLHRNKAMVSVLFITSVNWLVTGFVAHLLLRLNRAGGAGARP